MLSTDIFRFLFLEVVFYTFYSSHALLSYHANFIRKSIPRHKIRAFSWIVVSEKVNAEALMQIGMPHNLFSFKFFT